MKYVSLASGSKGNCHFVKEKHTSVIVDAGIALKNINKHLESHDIDLKSINAILVTHEHTDHAKSVGALSRKLDIPIYATEGTFIGMEKSLGKVSDKNIKIIKAEDEFGIGDIIVKSHGVDHDAKDPVCYRLEANRKNISFLTDLGVIRRSILDFIVGSNAVILESNHDINMLDAGPYPYELKMRIKSNFGHISNDTAGKMASELVKTGTTKIMLAHISQQNNMPILAYQSVASILKKNEIEIGCDLELKVLEQHFASESMEI